ncbi:MAG TPA: AraC family transcriptional regulator [Mycobacterium sp.]|jgi:AraC-like DNA-binding protein|nr:AraC family transcriptional regulator [Mycobacterium sp.]
MKNDTFAIHRPQRSGAAISDSAEIEQFLEGVYGVRLRGKENRPPASGEQLIHHRVDVGAFAIDDVRLPGELEFSPDQLDKVVAVWATEGRVEGRCEGLKGEAAAGEVTMLSQPDLPHHSRAEDLSVTSVLLEPAIVASVASGVPVGQAPASVRFDDFRPVDDAAARLWMSTVDYVRNCVLADDSVATPLVLGQASRLLAAVMVSTFPIDAAEASRHDRTDAKPVLLRRAIDYLESNVDNDIALAEIADAIHVTPRAVQYMFRKHLDTTPLQYLRQRRLHHAHQDLLEGDRLHDTVNAIAARWGFTHSGRFAVMYRETYGQSPHTTLRG